MASSAKTLGDASKPFEVDSTEQRHTIQGRKNGMYLHNVDLAAGGGKTAYVDFNDEAVTTGDGGSVPIYVGSSVPVPPTCTVFRAKTASGNSYLLLVKAS